MADLIDDARDRFAITNLEEGLKALEADPLADVTFRRNDGLKLTPASQHPLYVLMTVAGEPSEPLSSVPTFNNAALWGKIGSSRSIGSSFEIDEFNATLKALRSRSKFDDNEGRKLLNDAIAQGLDTKKNNPFRNLLEWIHKQDFHCLLFHRPVHLKDYLFHDVVSFNECCFLKPVFITQSKFENEINFEGCQFFGRVNFDKAVFKKSVSFKDSLFLKKTSFSSTEFQEEADFTNTTFRAQISFNHSKFEASTDFEGTNFRFAPPSFFKADIYENTIFPIADADVDRWPKMQGEVSLDGTPFAGMEPQKVMKTAGQKNSYGALRKYMNDAGRVDEEQFFHRREMACKIALESHPINRWLTRAYGFISDYGHAVGRPLLGLVGLFFAFAILFYCSMPPLECSTQDWCRQWASVSLSFANTFPYLGVPQGILETVKWNDRPVMIFLSGLQSLLALFLQFLIGLGLRSRFRLR